MALLLAAVLAGCGGGGGGGGPTSNTASAASRGAGATPASGSSTASTGTSAITGTGTGTGTTAAIRSSIESTGKGSTTGTGTGATQARQSTAPAPQARPLASKESPYAGVYQGNVKYTWFGQDRITDEVYQLSTKRKMLIDVGANGEIRGYLMPQDVGRDPAAFLQGRMDADQEHGTAELTDAHGGALGELALSVLSPQEAAQNPSRDGRLQAPLRAPLRARLQEKNNSLWVGELRPLEATKIPKHIEQWNIGSTRTFNGDGWEQLPRADDQLLGEQLTLTKVDGKQWTLRTAPGAPYRLAATLQRAAQREGRAAYNATITVTPPAGDGAHGNPAPEVVVDGKAIFVPSAAGPTLTLYSTDRRVQLWLTATQDFDSNAAALLAGRPDPKGR